jgi:SAM-dependent methyltransferase
MNEAHVVSYLCHEMLNVWNKYVHNDRRGWERMYGSNYAAKLESREQSARYWVVAGMIAELPAAKPCVLDVGCGSGTTYAHLRRRGVDYRGIDLSEAAVAAARAASDGDPRPSFEVADFDSFSAEPVYDAVILNEVLYYFSAHRAAEMVIKAHGLLREPRSVLVVSMSHSLKSRLAWKACGVLPRPVRRVTVRSRASSSRWTIAAFPRQASPRGSDWQERMLNYMTGGDLS